MMIVLYAVIIICERQLLYLLVVQHYTVVQKRHPPTAKIPDTKKYHNLSIFSELIQK